MRLFIRPANFSCVSLRHHPWWAVICDSSRSPDYHPDYPPRLSRGLSAVARCSRRRSKALIETHVNELHFRSRQRVRSRPVQMSKCNFSHFGLLGRLDRPRRAQIHAWCWHMSKKGTAWVQRCNSKRSRSRSGHKMSLNDKSQASVRHVFYGSFCAWISKETAI